MKGCEKNLATFISALCWLNRFYSRDTGYVGMTDEIRGKLGRVRACFDGS